MDKPGEMAVFVRAVEDGGFSAAARSLGMTPSAVSKLIGRLEDRLRVRLLHRTTRQLNLTHEGVAYYQRCARILKEIEAAEEAISELHAIPSGILRVNSAIAFARCQLVPIVPDFLAQYPDVTLELTVSDNVVDLVEEGIDIALRINVRSDPSLVVRTLAEDRRVICASPAYLAQRGTPLVPDDLFHHNVIKWVANQNNLNDWPFRHDGRDFTVSVDGTIAVNSGEMIYEMVLAGLGIGRLAELLVGPDIKTGRLVPLLVDSYRAEAFPIHAVYPHRRHLLPKVRVFIDFLVKRFYPVPPWRCTTPGLAETTLTSSANSVG